MRKQTKLVAVLSTSAVLALGASLTSLAATNWVLEDGVWVYYDKDGEAVTEEWKRSGANWYWLNEDGEMATDYLVEDDDDYYYVDEEGKMVTNQWVSFENEDYDEDDDDEPERHWYYFGSSGKALKASSSSNKASFKTINGKKYIFDDEGKMLYGWINDDGDRETGDDDWRNGTYYCGDENDGARREGQWELLEITDNEFDTSGLQPKMSSVNVFDDEDQERWFWFKTNGKKIKDDDLTWNGNKYYFDEDGRMNAEWVYYGTATGSDAKQGTGGFTTEWMYFGDPSDGARMTKGWFRAVPDEELHTSKYNDDTSYWYYADKDGNLKASEIETISGKKYAFDGYGRMKTGLKAIKFVEEGNTTDIVDVDGILADDNDDYPFDTEDMFKDNINELIDLGYHMYYFNKDGEMQTGKQTVTIDGDDFTFEFNKSGSTKGQGKFGEDDDKYYVGGMLLTADKEDKYAVVKVTKEGTEITKIEILDTDEFLYEVGAKSKIPAGKEDDYEEYYDFSDNPVDTDTVEYKLVNTSGKVQDDKSKAKDGDDRCFKVVNEKIVCVYVED